MIEEKNASQIITINIFFTSILNYCINNIPEFPEIEDQHIYISSLVIILNLIYARLILKSQNLYLTTLGISVYIALTFSLNQLPKFDPRDNVILFGIGLFFCSIIIAITNISEEGRNRLIEAIDIDFLNINIYNEYILKLTKIPWAYLLILSLIHFLPSLSLNTISSSFIQMFSLGIAIAIFTWAITLFSVWILDITNGLALFSILLVPDFINAAVPLFILSLFLWITYSTFSLIFSMIDVKFREWSWPIVILIISILSLIISKAWLYIAYLLICFTLILASAPILDRLKLNFSLKSSITIIVLFILGGITAGGLVGWVISSN